MEEKEKSTLFIEGRIESGQTLIDCLQQKITKTKWIHLEISNSPGGEVNVAEKIAAILDDFKVSGGKVSSRASGLVASAALFLYLQGDEGLRTASEDVRFMIDLPFKIEKPTIVLGHEETEELLRSFILENTAILNGKKRWALEISSETNLSETQVFLMEGKEVSLAEGISFGFCE